MLSEALEYPIKGKEVARTYLIAGFLWLINILVIPSIFFFGYLVKVSRETLQHKEELPRFSDIKKLFIDGLIFWIILFAYVVPGILVMSSAGFMYEYSEILGSLTSLTGFVLFTALLSIFPMAIAAFADKNNVAVAFRLRNLKYLLRKPYWVATISAFGVAVISSITVGVVAIVLLLTIVGILFIPILALVYPVYLYVFVFRVYTQAYKQIEGEK